MKTKRIRQASLAVIPSARSFLAQATSCSATGGRPRRLDTSIPVSHGGPMASLALLHASQEMDSSTLALLPASQEMDSSTLAPLPLSREMD